MGPAVSILDFLGRHATRFLAAGALLGLLVPQLATLARPLLVLGLVIPLIIALVRLDWGAIAAYAQRPALVGAIVAWILVVSPALMWLALKLVDLPPALVQALVLMTAAAPIVSCAALSLIMGLDAALAVVVVVAATALMPFTLPAVALALLGLDIDIDLATFMLRLVLIVGGAFSVAFVVRKFVSAEKLAANARVLDGASVAILLIFILAIMDGVTAVALARPGYVALVTLAAFVANIALQALGALAALKLGLRRALTVGFMTGNCNMGLVMVALADKADFDVIVFFAMAQLPMYMLPVLLRPIYRRLLSSR